MFENLLLKNKQNWANLIPNIVQFLNKILRDTTGLTSNELQTGCRYTEFWETIVTNPFIPNIPHNTKLIMAEITAKKMKISNWQNSNLEIKFE